MQVHSAVEPLHADAGHSPRRRLHAPAGPRRKTLCIVVPSHWERLMGGAEYQVSLLIERLRQLDRFDIHYVTRRAPPRDTTRGYEIHALGDGRPAGGAYFLDAPRLWTTLARLRPDVIYQRVACGHTGIAARYAQASGCRMVWHVASDMDLLPPPRKLSWRTPIVQAEQALVRYGARHASAIIVQSGSQAEVLKRYYGRTDATCISNFHPVATEQIVKPQDVVRVGWVANMKAVKRPELFLRLVRDLAHLPNIEFVMVGRPYDVASARARMAQQIQSLPNLRYIGEVPSVEANRFLAESHILVNTSAQEGFSNTFIQAWQRDVVVASLAVNPDGVFDDDRYGVFAGGHYDKLSASIAQLAQNAQLRADICARAKRFVREQFSLCNLDAVARVLDPSLASPSE